MHSGPVQRPVKKIIAKGPETIKNREVPDKPSYHCMADSRLLVEWTDIDALIAIDMVHPLICLRSIFVPVPEAFLSVKRPFQETWIG